jgi:hypothetical protein
MGLKARILKVTRPENGGPRKKSVLEGLARASCQAPNFGEIFRGLLKNGELVKYGARRDALYGPPGLRRRGGTYVWTQ